MSFQQPFAITQTNTLSTPAAPPPAPRRTCRGIRSYKNSTGFNCSTQTTQSNFGVNPNYRLGMVQVYNLGIQRTLPQGTVLNIDYTGAYAINQDILREPNRNASGVLNSSSVSSVTRIRSATSAPTHSPSTCASACTRASRCRAPTPTRTPSTTPLGRRRRRLHRAERPGPRRGGEQLQLRPASFPQRQLRHRAALRPQPRLPQQGRRLVEDPRRLLHLRQLHLRHGRIRLAAYTGIARRGRGGRELPATEPGLWPADQGRGHALPGSTRRHLPRRPLVLTAPPRATPLRCPGTVSISGSLSRTISFGGTRSFEARINANNALNTVQYSGVSTTINSSTFGQVTGAAGMRSFTYTAASGSKQL